MKRCVRHRPRLTRLVRLPSVRLTLGTVGLASVVAAASASTYQLWSVAVPLAVAVAVVVASLMRHRDRLAIELHMMRAMLRSHPRCRSHVRLPALASEARMEVLPDGVTRIDAGSWLDAVRVLGYVMGRDRGFQLDLLRMTAAGRLSEVWGRTALAVDRRYRPLQLPRAAERAAGRLETQEREMLTAFAEGVNAYLRGDGPPFESRFLSYQPRPWTVQDSLLVALYMFHALSWNEQAKRAEAVIRRAFPAAVAEFFLPAEPVDDVVVPEGLPGYRARNVTADDFVVVDRAVAGSNCWVQDGPGGPVLACDLHLPLTMPNLLYEVDVSWPGHRVRGLTTVGLPVVLTGTNGRITWGVTNLNADVLDLIPVTGTDAADGSGTGNLVTDREHVRIRGRTDELVGITRLGTMPIAPQPLLGERVALRWTGHDPRALDLKFHRLAHASSVDEAVRTIEDGNGIALNVLLADTSGHMAHVAVGLLPRRQHGQPPDAGGYLTGAERPRLVDPPSRLLVSANDAALPQEPFRIGYDLDPGHRARRVRNLLAERQEAGPARMRAMQHDVAAEMYLPYRALAVAALVGRDDRAADLLASWDGTAAAESVAFAVLVRLREILARRILACYLARCRELDPQFRYVSRSIDRPLLAILTSDDPSLLPPEAEPRGWADFLFECVLQAQGDLRKTDRKRSLPRWGELNAVGLNHPLQGVAPWAGPLLGIAATPQPGAVHCVRACAPGFAAAGRAVLPPGDVDAATFETPGGQSGHPLSVHFVDRHRDWSRAAPTASRTRRSGCVSVLEPVRSH